MKFILNNIEIIPIKNEKLSFDGFSLDSQSLKTIDKFSNTDEFIWGLNNHLYLNYNSPNNLNINFKQSDIYQ